MEISSKQDQVTTHALTQAAVLSATLSEGKIASLTNYDEVIAC